MFYNQLNMTIFKKKTARRRQSNNSLFINNLTIFDMSKITTKNLFSKGMGLKIVVVLYINELKILA